MKQYVVIGNGVAAVGCIEGIRSVDKDSKITVVSEENYPVYCRPLISYYLENKTDPERMNYRGADFYEKMGCDVFYEKKVIQINTDSKNVVLDDGYFETTFIRVPKSISELQEMTTAFLKGVRDEHYVYTFRTKRLELVSEESISWTLDGEYGGDHKNVLIENRMQALDFIV